MDNKQVQVPPYRVLSPKERFIIYNGKRYKFYLKSGLIQINDLKKENKN